MGYKALEFPVDLPKYYVVGYTGRNGSVISRNRFWVEKIVEIEKGNMNMQNTKEEFGN